MNIVEEGLYIGSCRDARNVVYNDLHFVQVLINVADKTFYKMEHHRLTFHHFPMNDYGDTQLNDVIFDITQAIDEALQSGLSVLVHCEVGVNRSATAVIAFLMIYRGMSFNDAFDHLRSVRIYIEPSPSYLQQLQNLVLE